MTAEEMLSKIIDGSPIPSFVIDEQHKVTHWNTAVESLSNIKHQEIIGTKDQWRSFYLEARPCMADLIVDRASASEIERFYQGKCRKSQVIDDAYEAEDFFPHLGENGKWLHFTASPIKDKRGEIIGAIETLQDISEQVKAHESRRFYLQKVLAAQEEERKRIACDLHDDTAQSLLLLIRRLDTLIYSNRAKIPRSTEEELSKLVSLAMEIHSGIKRYAQELRPAILDDLGLIAALEWMYDKLITEQGIHIEAEIDIVGEDLSREAQLVLFRIAQEAITNIKKHAEASKVVIKLKSEKHKMHMVISDNGKGFYVPVQLGTMASSGKLGIIGMQERVQLLGGTLNIQSRSGEGTSVIVEIPLEKWPAPP
jgi:signal transduction histidine kinase